MSHDIIIRKQAALERERLKQYYGVPPGRRDSLLVDIIIKNIQKYAARMMFTSQ